MRIGVEISGKNIHIGIIDGGQIFRKIVAPARADQDKDVITGHLIEMIHKIMNSNIRGIGVAVTGILKVDQGIVVNAVNIPAWKNVPLKDILEREFRIPVFLINDSNSFAFGERYYGEGTPYRDIVCLTLDIGVGAGIIINDELYSGFNAGAGEFGILPYLDANFEQYCGEKFFMKNNTTAENAYKLAIDGDSKMLTLWEELGGHLGNLIKTVLFTYDPQAIILGGSITKGYDLFAGKMFESVNQFPFEDTVKRIKVLISKNEDVNLLGAAAFVV